MKKFGIGSVCYKGYKLTVPKSGQFNLDISDPQACAIHTIQVFGVGDNDTFSIKHLASDKVTVLATLLENIPYSYEVTFNPLEELRNGEVIRLTYNRKETTPSVVKIVIGYAGYSLERV